MNVSILVIISFILTSYKNERKRMTLIALFTGYIFDTQKFKS